MRKRQDSRETVRRDQEAPDPFMAYEEYAPTDRRRAEQMETEPWDVPPEEAEPGGGVRHAQRIPLEKEAPPRKSHAVMARMVFLLACSVVTLIVLQETVFRLKTVYVVGNETKTPQHVASISGLVKGQNIFAISEEEIRRNISRDHTIELVSVQKEYPDKIYLYIRERKAVSAFQHNGMQFTLDEQGRVMSESNSLVLPEGMLVVTGFDIIGIQVGQLLSLRNEAQLAAYQAVISELRLQMFDSQISGLDLSQPDNLYLMTIDGISVRMGSAVYARAKIGAARTDLAYLRQLGKRTGTLDVSIPEDAKYTPNR